MIPTHPALTGVGCAIHFAHAISADLRGDFVDAEPRAAGEHQTGGSIAVSVARTLLTWVTSQRSVTTRPISGSPHRRSPYRRRHTVPVDAWITVAGPPPPSIHGRAPGLLGWRTCSESRPNLGKSIRQRAGPVNW